MDRGLGMDHLPFISLNFPLILLFFYSIDSAKETNKTAAPLNLFFSFIHSTSRHPAAMRIERKRRIY